MSLEPRARERQRDSRGPVLTLLTLLGVGCTGAEAGPRVLSADIPLHLEAAVLSGSEVPDDVPQPVGWTFDEAQPEWNAVSLAGATTMSSSPRVDL